MTQLSSGWGFESVTGNLAPTGLVPRPRGPVTDRELDSLPTTHPPRAASRRRTVGLAVKGATERVVALAALVLLLPVLLAVALAVRLDSRGPALFRQTRVGRDGRHFAMVKFRSMRTDAEAARTALLAEDASDGRLFKLREDPRITPLGRRLRTYSIDELPQLWNVVRGEMSLVGPRPALPEEVARYEFDPQRRLAVKPGLTGLWQVSGRSDLPWQEAIRLDLHYVENWSLWLDVRILLRTVSAVVSHRGAY